MGKSVAEIFGKRKHQPLRQSNELALPFAKVGVEIEVEGVKDDPERRRLIPREEAQAASPLPMWKTHSDNSLRDGLEFVTDGGLVGVDLVDAVRSACVYFEKKKYTVGHPRAGIHLHLDVTDINEAHPKQLLNLLACYMLCEHLLFGFAGEWRRCCGYTDALSFSKADYKYIGQALTKWDSLTDDELKNLWKGAPANGVYLSKYQAINLLPMMTLGTIEFRHLPTTFDAARIIKWINLVLCIKKFALESPEFINILEMASQMGIDRFIQRVFGEHYDAISHYIDHQQFWQAMDNVQAMLEPGRQDLFFVDAPVNELIQQKLKLGKAKSKQNAKKEAVAPAPLPPQQEDRQGDQFVDVMIGGEVRRVRRVLFPGGIPPAELLPPAPQPFRPVPREAGQPARVVNRGIQPPPPAAPPGAMPAWFERAIENAAPQVRNPFIPIQNWDGPDDGDNI